MSHFAQLDENNIVINVIAVADEDTSDENNVEIEAIGIAFCKSLFGEDTNWVQTSYNNNIRYNYASIGYSYDLQRDAFIPPQPFSSWILDEKTCLWKPPVEYPLNEGMYFWDEEIVNWVKDG